VIAADPYLRSAYYALAQGYRQLGKPEEARRHIALYQRLADNPRAQLVEFKYTRMGPRCEARTVGAANTALAQRPAGPLFGDPGKRLSLLPPAGGEAPIPNLTVVDIDADGQLDLFLAGRSGEPGTHNAVLLGQADGSFAVAANHPLTRVPGVNTALWGDYDNDGHTDVYLCRRGPNQLWRHSGDGSWQDVTAATGTDNGNLDTVDGALFDADHDGDLDLFLHSANS